MIIRKIKNTSDKDVAIKVEENTTVHMKPGQELNNINIENLEAVRLFTSVEYDLSEVQPVKEGRVKLND